MKNYKAKIISQKELMNLLNMNETLKFKNGFVDEQKIDWWGKLEKYLNEPIVSVRPSGRDSWDEIIVLTANGYIDTDKIVLDYNTADEIIEVLSDIFMEADNDEYEVFEHYSATCSNQEWQKVNQYIHEKF